MKGQVSPNAYLETPISVPFAPCSLALPLPLMAYREDKYEMK